ncbi:hypothetical protein LC55x_2103 [Lysobacter capsici]|nr:hypothetical protein LC55x_2103 [Lysobacter capsici]
MSSEVSGLADLERNLAADSVSVWLIAVEVSYIERGATCLEAASRSFD